MHALPIVVLQGALVTPFLRKEASASGRGSVAQWIPPFFRLFFGGGFPFTPTMAKTNQKKEPAMPRLPSGIPF